VLSTEDDVELVLSSDDEVELVLSSDDEVLLVLSLGELSVELGRELFGLFGLWRLLGLPGVAVDRLGVEWPL
jgi:hypothetical protein